MIGYCARNPNKFSNCLTKQCNLHVRGCLNSNDSKTLFNHNYVVDPISWGT